MHESIVFCSACTMSSQRRFTFALSSPDELLVSSADRTDSITGHTFSVSVLTRTDDTNHNHCIRIDNCNPACTGLLMN